MFTSIIEIKNIYMDREDKRVASIAGMKDTSEKTLEVYIVRRVRSMGGRCLKYSNPGEAGYPDRLILLPGGMTAFAEIKSKGKRPTALQDFRHEELRRLGFPVYVIDSRQDVDNAIRELTEEGGDGV